MHMELCVHDGQAHATDIHSVNKTGLRQRLRTTHIRMFVRQLTLTGLERSALKLTSQTLNTDSLSAQTVL